MEVKVYQHYSSSHYSLKSMCLHIIVNFFINLQHLKSRTDFLEMYGE
jgi:hypothetical protein